jgi:hypothetical protein
MNTRYIKFFEDFLPGNIERAITLTCNVLQKRTGMKILPVLEIRDEFINAHGRYSGIIATVGNTQQIRFNFLSNKLGAIDSVDIWFTIKFQPDLHIDTEGLSIVKIIPAIAEALDKQQGDFVIEESVQNKKKVIKEEFIPKTKGAVSKDISDSITSWSKTMGVDDGKLAKTRMKQLYTDYQYWYREVSDGSGKLVPEPTFRNYLIRYMQQNNIQNIFMRVVSINRANPEKSIANKKEADDFNAALYKMDVNDKMDFLRQSVRSVVRGYINSLVISGLAGVGKSTLVRDVIKEEGHNFVSAPGMFKKYAELYTFFYDHKDDLLVFDDVDTIFDKKYLGLTNVAFSDDQERLIQFPSEFGKDLPKKYKNKFVFNGKVIVITNLSKDRVPKSLASRGAVIEIRNTPSEVVDYIRQNIDNVMPEYPEATKQVKLEVLDFIEKALSQVKQIDFRVFKRCVIYRLSGTPNWRKYCLPIIGTI